MEGLQRVAGAAGTITLAGKEFRCAQITLGHLSEVEAYIVSQRAGFIDTVAEQIKNLPRDLQDRFIAASVKQAQSGRTVSREDMREFLSTREGNCYLLWCMIRDAQPEYKHLASVIELCNTIPILTLEAKVDVAAGLSDAKNSDGLAASQAEAVTE